MDDKVQKIGEILANHLPANMVKLSKFKCPRCGRVAEKGLFDVCFLCHRQDEFSAMPPEQREIAVAEYVPKRYRNAKIEELAADLRGTIAGLSSDKGLFLWGAQGVGKTYAMCAIMRKYISEGYRVERLSYEMLCLKLRDTYKLKSEETELSIIEPLLKVDKLFVEDVGMTEIDTESKFSLKTFFILLDQRLEQMLPTFITTNRPLEELRKTFDARITSRIMQGCEIIQCKGKDKRDKKYEDINAN